MKKHVIYIASPYTHGDPAINTRFQCEIFDRMLTDGIVLPYAPLWSHFQHCIFPRNYKDWISYDLDLIRNGVFSACLRLGASYEPMGYDVWKSSGATNETILFRSMGLPVFAQKTTVDEVLARLYNWAGQEHLPLFEQEVPDGTQEQTEVSD